MPGMEIRISLEEEGAHDSRALARVIMDSRLGFEFMSKMANKWV